MNHDQNNNPQAGDIVSEYSRSPFRGRGSLTQVVHELRRQAEAKCDFVADTRDMEFGVNPRGGLVLMPRDDNLRDFLPRAGIPLLDQAIQQVAVKAPIPAQGDDKRNAGIPLKFFKSSLRKHPRRTTDYLNGVMHDDSRRRLVRCLDDRVRAFVSDQYRVIDTLDVAKQALAILKDLDGKVIEASVTDSHVRLKLVATDIWQQIENTRTTEDGWYASGLGNPDMLRRVSAQSRDDLRPLTDKMRDQGGPDTVWPVATISNSETGHGGLSFRGGLLKAVCFNLATVEEVLRAVHLGSRLEAGIYTRETVESESETIFLKMRDNLGTWFTAEKFADVCQKMAGTAMTRIEKPSAAVGLIVKACDALVDDDTDSILDYFMAENRTVHGLGQAISRLAQDTEDASRAETLEDLAGEMLMGKHTGSLVGSLLVGSLVAG